MYACMLTQRFDIEIVRATFFISFGNGRVMDVEFAVVGSCWVLSLQWWVHAYVVEEPAIYFLGIICRPPVAYLTALHASIAAARNFVW